MPNAVSIYTISGLRASTNYYITIEVVNSAWPGLVSSFSNVVHVATGHEGNTFAATENESKNFGLVTVNLVESDIIVTGYSFTIISRSQGSTVGRVTISNMGAVSVTNVVKKADSGLYSFRVTTTSSNSKYTSTGTGTFTININDQKTSSK